MIERREFITLLGGVAALGRLMRGRSSPAKIARIGLLRFGPASAYADQMIVRNCFIKLK